MNKDEYHDLYNAGLKLKKEGNDNEDAGDILNARAKYVHAIEIFENLFNEEFETNKFNKCMVLGTLYDSTDDKKKSLEMFAMAAKLNHESELASLCLYLRYVESDQSEKAIDELKRFLRDHSADPYKVTLQELLEEVREGRLPFYRDEILALAIRNNITIQ